MRDLQIIPIDKFGEGSGERILSGVLSGYSCPLNAEVEDFLKNKALQSAKLATSKTYLVFGADDGSLLGYFTLSVKSYTIESAKLNSAKRRLIERFADRVGSKDRYSVAVYLIAQIGRNYAQEVRRGLSGRELLQLAFAKLREVNDRIGGKIVLVERESDRPKLHAFYSANGFSSWNERTNERDGIVYDQMIAVL